MVEETFEIQTNLIKVDSKNEFNILSRFNIDLRIFLIIILVILLLLILLLLLLLAPKISGGLLLSESKIAKFFGELILSLFEKFKIKKIKLKKSIKSETGWSNKTVNAIYSKEQYEIYKKAGLKEAYINGKKCLIKDYIDIDYIDPKTGLTNRELMERGRSPIDSNTGEKIELHHMGQEFDAPFAELLENSEHGDGNHKTLHPNSQNSWRNDTVKENAYNQEKCKYWKSRINRLLENKYEY